MAQAVKIKTGAQTRRLEPRRATVPDARTALEQQLNIGRRFAERWKNVLRELAK